MSEEEQRIAIAEACGWTEIEPCTCCDGVSRGYTPTPGAHKKHLPDYLNDLNAMHCAEEMLTDDQWVEYRENIRTVVLGPVRYVSQWCKADIHSTARQRAEAFLRTIGKWKEAKP